MAAGWIERVIGPLEQKRQYKEHKARIAGLPDGHRAAAEAIERYLMYFGSSDGEVLITMVGDLADLFEQSASDGVAVRGVVGDDPVGFAEAFLSNYSSGQWIAKERARLVAAIDTAAGMTPR